MCACVCMHAYLCLQLTFLGAPLFSNLDFCMASCSYNFIYNTCEDGGAVGFVDFTKLLFALSSLTPPFNQ